MGLRRRLAAVCVCVAALAGPVAAAGAWTPLDGGFGDEDWLGAIHWDAKWAGPPSDAISYPEIAFLDSGINQSPSSEFADLVGPDSADCVSGVAHPVDSAARIADNAEPAGYHGTEVATLAAAPADGAVNSYVGVAPFAPVVFVRVTRSEFDVSQAGCGVNYLHRIARDEPVIANMSFDATRYLKGSTVQRLVKDQALIVAALPNARDPLHRLPGSYAGNPAGLQHTLAVGDAENRLYPQGTTQIDVLAPGSFTDLPAANFGLSGAPRTFAGTSFATALVSGAADLVWAHAGGGTIDNPQVVAYLLRRTASAGTAWSRRRGFGLINVSRAVTTTPPKDDEYEPNDTAATAWNGLTTPRACARTCRLSGIVGKTDDAQDWWPVKAGSCRGVRVVVRNRALRSLGCKRIRSGRVAVGVAAGRTRRTPINAKNALATYTLLVTAR